MSTQIIEDLQNNFKSIYLKNKKKQVREIKKHSLDTTKFSWLETGIRRLKLFPIQIEYTDGSVDICIAIRYDNEDFSNGIRALEICEDNLISTFPVIGAINSTDEYKFIITRFVEGVVPFSEYKIDSIEMFIQMLIRGIDEIKRLHSIGLIHGDFEPRNIGIDEQGETYIYDFEGAEIYAPEIPPKNRRDMDINQFKSKLIKQALKSGHFQEEELKEIAEEY